MTSRRNGFTSVIFVLTVTFLLLTNNAGFARIKGKPVSIGESIELQSTVLKEKRTILIHLPAGYNQSQNKYPVLYLLDGESHFHHATGITQFLSMSGIIPQMIVVAIINTDRARDLSPSRIADIPTSGGADKFLKFLRDELIPVVEKNYRTHPFRILNGHSLGGLFTIHTLLTRPDTFNAYLVTSPYLLWNQSSLLKNLDSLLGKQKTFKNFLFITVGNESKLLPSLFNFEKILKTKAPKGLIWKFDFLRIEDHLSITHNGIYRELINLYSGWRVPKGYRFKGLVPLQKHYENLSKKYGYKIQISANMLNDLGYQFIELKQIDRAIKVFNYCIQIHPNFWFSYHNAGYCYQQKGDKKMAIKNYEKSVQLNPNNKLGIQRIKKLKGEK